MIVVRPLQCSLQSALGGPLHEAGLPAAGRHQRGGVRVEELHRGHVAAVPLQLPRLGPHLAGRPPVQPHLATTQGRIIVSYG